MIAILNAAGITAAKIVIFLLVYYGRNITFPKRAENRLFRFKRIAKNHRWRAILLGSILPARRDVIYFTLDIAKYNK